MLLCPTRQSVSVCCGACVAVGRSGLGGFPEIGTVCGDFKKGIGNGWAACKSCQGKACFRGIYPPDSAGGDSIVVHQAIDESLNHSLRFEGPAKFTTEL